MRTSAPRGRLSKNDATAASGREGVTESRARAQVEPEVKHWRGNFVGHDGYGGSPDGGADADRGAEEEQPGDAAQPVSRPRVRMESPGAVIDSEERSGEPEGCPHQADQADHGGCTKAAVGACERLPHEGCGMPVEMHHRHDPVGVRDGRDAAAPGEREPEDGQRYEPQKGVEGEYSGAVASVDRIEAHDAAPDEGLMQQPVDVRREPATIPARQRATYPDRSGGAVMGDQRSAIRSPVGGLVV